MIKPLMQQDVNGDYQFRDDHFHFICSIAQQRAGIVLSEMKREMIYQRLVRRLRMLNVDSFDSYIEIVKNGDSNEIIEFTNSITSNPSSFFLEKYLFDFLQDTALSEYLRTDRKSIRIWSVGCATGEEPYSLAMTATDILKNHSGINIRILATDLDSQRLSIARRGNYTQECLQSLSIEMRNRWFISESNDCVEMMQVVPEIKNLVEFKQLNLLKPWPMKNKFDIIFCRNIANYFMKDAQGTLFDRFSTVLNPDGYLVIGQGESLQSVSTVFNFLENTIYQLK